nr:glycoprotein [Rice thrips mononega-like virus 1]
MILENQSVKLLALFRHIAPRCSKEHIQMMLGAWVTTSVVFMLWVLLSHSPWACAQDPPKHQLVDDGMNTMIKNETLMFGELGLVLTKIPSVYAVYGSWNYHISLPIPCITGVELGDFNHNFKNYDNSLTSLFEQLNRTEIIIDPGLKNSIRHLEATQRIAQTSFRNILDSLMNIKQDMETGWGGIFEPLCDEDIHPLPNQRVTAKGLLATSPAPDHNTNGTSTTPWSSIPVTTERPTTPPVHPASATTSRAKNAAHTGTQTKSGRLVAENMRVDPAMELRTGALLRGKLMSHTAKSKSYKTPATPVLPAVPDPNEVLIDGVSSPSNPSLKPESPDVVETFNVADHTSMSWSPATPPIRWTTPLPISSTAAPPASTTSPSFSTTLRASTVKPPETTTSGATGVHGSATTLSNGQSTTVSAEIDSFTGATNPPNSNDTMSMIQELVEAMGRSKRSIYQIRSVSEPIQQDGTTVSNPPYQQRMHNTHVIHNHNYEGLFKGSGSFVQVMGGVVNLAPNSGEDPGKVTLLGTPAAEPPPSAERSSPVEALNKEEYNRLTNQYAAYCSRVPLEDVENCVAPMRRTTYCTDQCKQDFVVHARSHLPEVETMKLDADRYTAWDDATLNLTYTVLRSVAGPHLTNDVLEDIVEVSNKMHRGRRSNFFAHLWGACSTEERDAMAAKIESLSTQVGAVHDFTTESIRNMDSLVSAKLAAVDDVVLRMSRNFNDIATQHNNRLDELRSALLNHTIIVTLIHQLTTMNLYLMSQLKSNELHVQNMEIKMRSLQNTLKTGTISSTLVTADEIRRATLTISQNLPDGYMLAPVTTLADYYKAPMAKMMLYKSKIYLQLQFDILPSYQSYATYQVTALPVAVGSRWFHLRDLPEVFSIHKEAKEPFAWSIMSQAIYKKGMDHPLHTLKDGMTTGRDWGANCLAKLLSHNPSYNISCVLAEANPNVAAVTERTYIAQVGLNMWAISTNTTHKVLLHCLDTMSTPKQVIIEHVTTMKIPGQCSINGPAFRLIPYNAALGSTTFTREVYFPYQLVWGNVSVVPWVPPSLRPSKWVSQVPSVEDLDSLIGNHTLHINNLMIDYKAKQAKTSAKFNATVEGAKLREMLASMSMNFASWASWVLSAVLILAVIGLIIYCVCVRSNPAVRGASLLGSIPLQRVAAEVANGTSIVVVNATTTTTIAPPLSNASLIQQIGKVLDHTMSTIQSSFWTPYLFHTLLWLTGIGLMSFYFYCHVKCLQRVKRRLLVATNWTPRTMNVIHHEGEVKLRLWFIISVKHLWRKDNITTEAAIQASTLVGNWSDWTCEFNSSQPSFIKAQTFKRWQQVFRIKVSWGSLCLKSSRYPVLDTCAELPDYLEVKASEILAQCHDVMPWTWGSVEFLNICRVEVIPSQAINLFTNYGS